MKIAIRMILSGVLVMLFSLSLKAQDCQGSCPSSHPLFLCGQCWVDDAQAQSGGCSETCSSNPTPTCSDGIQNGNETGIDCGGSCPNSCDSGGTDCSGSCLQGYNLFACGQCWVDAAQAQSGGCSETCSDPGPTCSDGIQNGDETGIDCGGSCPNSCQTEPTCSDGIQNGDETGIDCGGSCPNSCQSGPTCTDGIQNGNETGIDCGGSCPNSCPPPPNGDLAFLEPTNGAKLLFIGQDLLSVSDYINDCGGCPTPGGIATYVSLSGVLQNNFYGALGFTESDQPFGTDIDWGGGPLNAYSAAIGFPNSAVQIGLYLVGETDNISSGGRDAEIRQLADFFNSLSGTAFYLRVGYEFDGQWNGYSGQIYINAYRRIVDILRAENVSNVAYVWQSSTSPIDDVLDGGRENLLNYYPGDNYVDWFGMSWFLLPNENSTVGGTPSTQLYLANEIVNLARQRGKPMMICEAAAQGYDIQQGANSNISPVWDGASAQGTVNKSGSQIWNEWFQEYFNYINANDDVIKAVTYINADWDSQGLWDSPYEQGYWGDTRIQVSSTVENNWVNEITQSGWLHGSSNLNAFLNGMNSTGARVKPASNLESTERIEEAILLYPNPVKDILRVQGVSGNQLIRIFTTSGKIIKTFRGNNADVSQLNYGLYFIEVGDIKMRFIKQ
ncbi:MAG: T9SS type A sorting domain-containing protein [bacterium]|nr:T9SS type A sorting domain-containing protein [bacterium]